MFYADLARQAVEYRRRAHRYTAAMAEGKILGEDVSWYRYLEGVYHGKRRLYQARLSRGDY